ncbi:MAG: PfkB family carbohydrate kinase [Sediminicola sp.]|tara:strand:+ start:81148 stop:82080 length:933 start_codon:yes stop_codon:yes gene_type:complete
MVLCICPNPAIDKFIYTDNFGLGKVNRAHREVSFPGGKGIHVALGLKELGEEVILLGFWGGTTGKWIKKECEDMGIPCYGPELEQASRTCITIRSNNGSNNTEILELGPLIGQMEYNLFWDTYIHLLQNAESVCMSGSWPLNSMKANYGPFIKKAGAMDIKSFVDCSGWLLEKALKEKPYGIHVNQHEVQGLFKSSDIEENCLKLERSCTVAAITYGEKGLYLFKENRLIHSLSKVKAPLSTVGCGDSLMAGWVAAHKRGYDLLDTAKLAASAGAANCMREELGMFHKKDVELFFRTCSTQEWILKNKPY